MMLKKANFMFLNFLLHRKARRNRKKSLNLNNPFKNCIQSKANERRDHKTLQSYQKYFLG